MISDFFKKPGSQSGAKVVTNDIKTTVIEEEGSSKKERTTEEKAQDPFMTFDEFRDGLGSWKGLLAKYTASPKFLGLYNKVKEAYIAGKGKCYPPKD